MNIITSCTILQLLLIVGAGNVVAGERKEVGCYYFGVISEKHGTLFPEDIDTSICTHLRYVHGAINNETQEIKLEAPTGIKKSGGKDFVPRLAELKGVNPDLKLILLVVYDDASWHLQEPSRRSEIIQSGIKWLNESGFDGLEIAFAPILIEDVGRLADFLCEMKNEFDKYSFSLSTSITGAEELVEGTLAKISRCSNSVTLLINRYKEGTHRLVSMNVLKSNVDWYIENGLSPSKISIVVPLFGAIFTLSNPKDTGLGAAVNGPANVDREIFGGLGIRNKELIRMMNDSSLSWTIRRENETQEPYAFTTTGLWTSYEDTTSMEYKARYVLEKGLGGIVTAAIDYEDDEGIGGEGRFPLTRTIYKTFNQPNHAVDQQSTSE